MLEQALDEFANWIKGQDSVPWDEQVDEKVEELKKKYDTR